MDNIARRTDLGALPATQSDRGWAVDNDVRMSVGHRAFLTLIDYIQSGWQDRHRRIHEQTAIVSRATSVQSLSRRVGLTQLVASAARFAVVSISILKTPAWNFRRVDRIGLAPDERVFRIQVLVDAFQAAFAPETRLLHSPEGSRRIGHDARIHAHHSGV